MYPSGINKQKPWTIPPFFHGIYQSKWVKFHGDLLAYWSSAHLQEHPQWRLDDKCDQKPPQVSPFFLSKTWRIWETTCRERRKNILYLYICMFTLSKTYVWYVIWCNMCICIPSLLVSNMNLQATKSYNFHIIKSSKSFSTNSPDFDDPHSAGMLHCYIKVPNDCWAFMNPLFQHIWMWEHFPQHELLFVAFLRDLKCPHSAGI